MKISKKGVSTYLYALLLTSILGCLALIGYVSYEPARAFIARAMVHAAVAGPYTGSNGQSYYVVDSTIPSEDTGDEVCAAIGLPCLGYSLYDSSVCTQVHPTASVDNASVNGSKAGYYCDGAPQTGLACSTSSNSCKSCPGCTVGVTCSEPIGTLYREMYVQCGFIGSETAVSAAQGALGTNAHVDESVVHNGNLYIGGEFTVVGPTQEHMTIVNATTGTQNSGAIADADGVVGLSVSDQTGGWFIAGLNSGTSAFNNVSGVSHIQIAHILSDGSVDPNFTASVSTGAGILAMVYDGTLLYIGGNFTVVNGGSTRPRLAALSPVTGALAAWNPLVNNQVSALDIDGTTIYVGGSFTSAGGQTRNRMAKYTKPTSMTDTTHNSADATWNPNVSNGAVTAITHNGTNVYIGGSFTGTVGGSTRTRLAAVAKTGAGAVTTWNPTSTVNIGSLQLDGTDIFVRLSGNVNTTIGSNAQSRKGLAKVHTGDNLAVTTFNASPDFAITGFVFDGVSRVYVGGTFTTVGGIARPYLAKIDSATGAGDTSFTATPLSDGANTVSLQGSSLFVGGGFTVVGGVQRDGLAAFDSNLNLLPWNPSNTNFGYFVEAMAASGSAIYVAGEWSQLAPFAPHNHVIAFDDTTGAVLAWDPTPNNTVNALDISGSTVYMGGQFTSAGGQARNAVAAVDATTGLATSWNPNVTCVSGEDCTGTASVYSLKVDTANNLIFLGGNEGFSRIGGASSGLGGTFYRNLAAVDLTTGAGVKGFDITASGTDIVYGLAHHGSNIAATGFIFNVNGTPTVGYVEINPSTFALSSFLPNFETGLGDAFGSFEDGNNLYVVGDFTEVDNVTHGMTVLIDPTNTIHSWDPQITRTNGNTIVETGGRLGNYLALAGEFSFAQTVAASNLAFFASASAPDAVTDLAATPLDSHVTLAWTAPADNGSPITDYIVEYWETATPTIVTVFSDGVSAATGANVTGLTNGTGYSFRVSAISVIGTSATSNVATATPIAIPDPINNLVATPSDTQIVLTWTTPSGGPTDYVVQCGTTAGLPGSYATFADGTSAMTTAIVTGLTNETSYTCRVYATNSMGTSPASNIVATTPTTPSWVLNTTDTMTATQDAMAITNASGVIEIYGASAPAQSNNQRAFYDPLALAGSRFSTSTVFANRVQSGKAFFSGGFNWLFAENTTTFASHQVYKIVPGGGAITPMTAHSASPFNEQARYGMVGGFVYQIGGFQQTVQNFLDVYRYELATDTWVTSGFAPLPAPARRQSTIEQMNGLLYYVGGDTSPGTGGGSGGDATVVTTLDVYNPGTGPGTDSWDSTKADMPGTGRAEACSVVYDGLMYVLSGRGLTAVRQEVFRYDPTYDEWAKAASLTKQRGFCTAAVSNNLLHTFFGKTQGASSVQWGDLETMSVANVAPTTPTNLFIDETDAQTGSNNPTGITSGTPVFSAICNDPNWSDRLNQYHIQVASDNAFTSVVWDSGAQSMTTCRQGTRSANILFAGTPLALDGATYYWRIKFFDDDGAEGAYSETTSTATFTMTGGNNAPTAPTTLYSNNTDAQAGSTNPTGITSATPVFSAICNDPDVGDTLNKYRIQVDNNNDFSSVVWDSGASGTSMTNCTAGSRSANLTFGGTPLTQDGTTYYWRIKFWDDEAPSGTEGVFSESPTSTNTFTMAAGDTTGPQLTVIQPNGGETIAQNALYTITWTAIDDSGTVSGVDLEYTTDNSTYFPIAGATGLPSGNTYPFVSIVAPSGAGNGQVTSPRGAAFAPDGSFYVVDSGAARVQKFDANGNFLLTWGSAGTGDGQFDTGTGARGIVVDSLGNVYVADAGNDRIQKFNSSGTFLTKWGTTGTGTGQFRKPFDLAVDSSDNIYTIELTGRRIQKFTSAGVYITGWGFGDFAAPRGIAVDSAGNVYASDSGPTNVIRKYDSAGVFQFEWGTFGTATGSFDRIAQLDTDAYDRIYAVESNNNRVQRFDTAGTFQLTFGVQGAANGELTFPEGLGVSRDGVVLVADTNNNRVQKFAPGGSWAWTTPNVTTSLARIRATATDPSSNSTIDTSDAVFTLTVVNSAPTAPTTLFVNNVTAQVGTSNPSGITSATPVFSAICNDPDSGDILNKYRIQVDTTPDFSTPILVWDSGLGGTSMTNCTAGSRSSDITFGGTPLTQNGATYYWRIKFWDDEPSEGVFSEDPISTNTFTMAVPGNNAPTAPTLLFSNNTNAQFGSANPTGITSTTPVFSAICNDPDSGDVLNKYRIEVDDNSDFSSMIWDSGSSGTSMISCVEGSRSQNITFGGAPLTQNGTTYYWRIKFWDDEAPSGTEGVFSESPTSTQTFTMATASGGGGGTSIQRLQQLSNLATPVIGPVTVTSPTSVRFQWSYEPTADILGFRLINDQDAVVVETNSPTSVAAEERGLPHNSLVSGRTVTAYTSAGESAPSDVYPDAYTFMIPVSPRLDLREGDKIHVSINEDVNNLATGQSGVQFELISVGSASAAAVTQSPWLQATEYTFDGVSSGTTYLLRSRGRNFNATETIWSTTIPVPGQDFVAPVPMLTVSLAMTASDGQALNQDLNPNSILTVQMTVANIGMGAAQNALLTLPIPDYILYIPGTLSVDGRKQSDAADTDEAQAGNSAVAAIWPQLDFGTSHTVYFQLGFDTLRLIQDFVSAPSQETPLRTTNITSDVIAQALAAANPQMTLQAQASHSDDPTPIFSDPQIVTADVAVLAPAPAPAPAPVPPAPPQPPTPQQVQIIQNILQQQFPQPGVPAPVPSIPQGNTSSSLDGGSFSVTTTNGTDSLTMNGHAITNSDLIQFTGTTSQPFAVVTLIINGSTLVIATADANGNWQTFVSAEQLGIRQGETAMVTVEAIAASGSLQSDRVKIADVMISRASSGEIVADFTTLVSDQGIVSRINRAAAVVAAQEPAIQTALVVSVPVVIASSIPLWGYLPYVPSLIYHFTGWILGFLGRRKKKDEEHPTFGVVYDSITKLPMPLAIVRIYEKATKKLVSTTVTDKYGRYDVLLRPGMYAVEVSKPQYQFPSSIVTTPIDGQYDRVYDDKTGATVAAKSSALPNIPIDPINVHRQWELSFGARKLWLAFQRLGNHVATPIMIVGFAMSVALVYAVPTRPLNWIILGLYAVTLGSQLKLKPKLLKAWGVVYDLASDAILPLVAIQLIEPAGSKVVASRLSDYDGRFTFLPEPGMYVVKASKPGYNQVTEVVQGYSDRQQLPQQVHIEKLNQRISGDVAMKQTS